MADITHCLGLHTAPCFYNFWHSSIKVKYVYSYFTGFTVFFRRWSSLTNNWSATLKTLHCIYHTFDLPKCEAAQMLWGVPITSWIYADYLFFVCAAEHLMQMGLTWLIYTSLQLSCSEMKVTPSKMYPYKLLVNYSTCNKWSYIFSQ